MYRSVIFICFSLIDHNKNHLELYKNLFKKIGINHSKDIFLKSHVWEKREIDIKSSLSIWSQSCFNLESILWSPCFDLLRINSSKWIPLSCLSNCTLYIPYLKICTCPSSSIYFIFYSFSYRAFSGVSNDNKNGNEKKYWTFF